MNMGDRKLHPGECAMCRETQAPHVTNAFGGPAIGGVESLYTDVSPKHWGVNSSKRCIIEDKTMMRSRIVIPKSAKSGNCSREQIRKL